MDRQKPPIPKISLSVDADALAKFTTLLQAGIFLDICQGESIGGLLASLPGFTEDYITQRVQTIFLDGFPADDLDQQLQGSEVVLAVSAAMPGLAGAIFRKNGVHAALRTTAGKMVSTSPATDTSVTVRLKLFNVIAVETGEQILAGGCVIAASALGKFLAYRSPLSSRIGNIETKGQSLTVRELLELLTKKEKIKLTVRRSHEC